MINQVNLIGLDNEKAQALANELNELLAHYQCVLHEHSWLPLEY